MERLFLLENQKGFNGITLDIAFKHYLKDKGLYLKPSTLATNQNIYKVRIAPKLGHLKLNEITLKDLSDWQRFLLEDLNISLSSASLTVSVLSSLLTYCVDFLGLKENKLKKLPPLKAKTVQAKKSKTIWTVEDLKKALELTEDIRIKMFLNLAFYTGLRRGELLGLSWENVDFENAILTVEKNLIIVGKKEVLSTPKNSKTRNISVPSFLIDELKAYKKASYFSSPQDFIFPFKWFIIYEHLEKLHELHGLPKINIHALRHSHTSELFARGFDIPFISERLGHAKISTTLDTYTHLHKNQKKKQIQKLNTINI